MCITVQCSVCVQQELSWNFLITPHTVANEDLRYLHVNSLFTVFNGHGFEVNLFVTWQDTGDFQMIEAKISWVIHNATRQQMLYPPGCV